MTLPTVEGITNNKRVRVRVMSIDREIGLSNEMKITLISDVID
jgi:hypothetical protein